MIQYKGNKIYLIINILLGNLNLVIKNKVNCAYKSDLIFLILGPIWTG